MTRLLLDSGNTRIKWMLDDGASGAVVHAGEPAAAVRTLLAGMPDVDELVLVDVTGKVSEAVPGGVRVRSLASEARACGVVNGYADPHRLGADRWAALLGARATTAGAACIVDAGSAITADVLAADGRHLGGWIAPGLQMSLAALAGGTTQVRVAPGEWPSQAPATNTDGAAHGGALHAALGFVERALRAARSVLADEPVLLLTGGDAPQLAPELAGAKMLDDLVLRGLAAWADSR